MAAYDSLHQAYKYGGGVAGSAIGTVNGVQFDTQGMEEVLAVLAVGIASGTLDVKVQHSATGSVWADLSGASFSQKVDADDNKTYVGRIIVNKSGTNRYLRLSGTVSSAPVNWGAVFIGGGLHDKPVTQDETLEFSVNEETSN